MSLKAARSFSTQKPILSVALNSSTKGSKRDPILDCRILIPSTKLSKKFLRRSLYSPMPVSRGHTFKRSCSANLDEVFKEVSSEYVEGLSKMIDTYDYAEIEEKNGQENSPCTVSKPSYSASKHSSSMYDENSFLRSKLDYLEPLMLGIRPEPPDWPEREEVIRASIERKANRVELPLSLRMIKKKQKQKHQEGFQDIGDSDCCSMKKVFSSMEFIVIELQSYALQMREVLCHEDLEGIIFKVQKEMHISFLWLFQQVFSQTPALMVSVMILLASFSLHSTARNLDILESSIPGSVCESRTDIMPTEQHNQLCSQNGSSLMELVSFKDNSGDERVHPVSDGIGDGDRQLSRSSQSIDYPSFAPDHNISQELGSVEEVRMWKSMVDEAKKMQVFGLRDVVLDHEEMQCFVSPLTVKLEQDNYVDYIRTDLLYQMGLSQEPNNSLLLCNYAQFLHLVAHDHDRAEECFKRAIQVEPPDAESLSQYANFLWTARKDLWGAEERYLQAMAEEPYNSYHASRYANFLWSTGGEDTCFPLNSSQNNNKTSNL